MRLRRKGAKVSLKLFSTKTQAQQQKYEKQGNQSFIGLTPVSTKAT